MEDLQMERSFLAEARRKPQGLLSETIAFMRYHRKWWLGPIVLTVLLLGLLVVLGGTGVAPFIYTLF